MADFLSEAVELGESFGASGIRHPIEFLQTIAEDSFEIIDEFNHSSAGSGREMFLDEKFAECFADFPINDPGRTLPAWLLNFLVAKNFSVESEGFVFGG